MKGRVLLALLVVVAGLVAAPAASHAEPIDPITSLSVEMLDSAGDPEVRAGAHPDRMVMTILLDLAAGNLKDLTFDLPPGFAGSANAVPTCPRHLISIFTTETCPSSTQIGTIEIVAFGLTTVAALHSLDPAPGYLAEFGFKSLALDGRMFIRMLPNGQARFEMHDSVQDTALSDFKVEVWGVPADHQTAPTAARRAFLGMATSCDGAPPEVSLRMRTWQAPETWHSATRQIGPPLVGCENLDLEPQLDFAVDDTRTDSPTGVGVTVDIPNDLDPDGEPTARAKEIHIDFPEGMSLSPGAADGLVACSEDAARQGQPGPAACPSASRVGAAEIDSPMIDEPIEGAVHLGRQLSDTDYRMYVVLNDGGIDIELAGVLHADPETGRLSVDIADVPELTFDRMKMTFGGGARALFATPQKCGSGTASIALATHSGGPPATATAPFATTGDPFGRPCPALLPFEPDFTAGTLRTRAGEAAPLAVTIRRASGEQLIDRFAMTFPAGLTARVATVPPCPAAAATTGSCPPESRVGTAIAEVGSGDGPLVREGDVFLTGPYRGAPFGMTLVFGGVVGPFDLGTVTVRAALRVDPLTGQVTVETDPVPRMVRGVPLRIQTLALDVDRPGFMTNPTSCAPSAITATIESADGATSRARSRFAVGGCRALRFRPAMRMALVERPELHADGHPGLRMNLRFASRDANLRDLSFELPEIIEPSVVGPAAICSLRQLERGRCPAASAVGRASARTPVLSKPLKGKLYSVQPPGNGVADVWAVMRGSGVSVRLRMKSALDDGRLRGRLVDLPDVPFSSLDVTFAGGKHGMLSLDRAPCRNGVPRRMVTDARLTAHSAAKRRAVVPVRVGPGCASRARR